MIDRRQKILSSFKKLFAGVVRLCLRNGVSYKELIQVIKSLYVSICEREYGIQGRPTNVSRIALMTGLDRKDIRRELDRRESEARGERDVPPDRIAKILTAWHQDSVYIDENQQPLAIPAEGKAPSFEALAKALAGDMPTVTILRELKRSKTVIENEAGSLEVKKAYYIPNYFTNADEEEPELANPEALEHGCSMLVDHINTVFYNLYRDDKSLRQRIELRATNQDIPVSDVPEFYKLVDKKAMELLYEIDEWLEQRQNISSKDEPRQRLGLGVYFIQGENQSFSLNEHRDAIKKSSK